ncbi:MAG: dTDP-glucose pyrophosphorylase, partial [Gammaproteobacteria bacterium]|nr:dTDP-glucose pyrophosphorylase [Gammaproteobacteria bacterium]
MVSDSEVIGVIPAAGRAARISPLPCSKEIYPVGLRRTPDGALRPKAACHYLLERMREAGIAKAYIVLRDGKWDIPAYLEDGAAVGMQLAYLIADSVVGTPYTVDRARAFVADANVAFGFPDMLLGSEDIFVRLLARQRESEADLILGSFPAEPGLAADLLDVDADGRVRRLSVGPPDARLQRTWGVAAWRPAFTEYLH